MCTRPRILWLYVSSFVCTSSSCLFPEFTEHLPSLGKRRMPGGSVTFSCGSVSFCFVGGEFASVL